MTTIQVKQQIDAEITNKTVVDSINPVMVGTNMKNIVDLIPVRNYKIYVAQFSNVGGVISVNVLENTIGNIVWSVNAINIYSANLPNAFIKSKTHCLVTGAVYAIGTGINDIVFGLVTNNNSTINLYHTLSGNVVLNQIELCYLEIRVYN
jgi:hypothetical protein